MENTLKLQKILYWRNAYLDDEFNACNGKHIVSEIDSR